MSATYKKVTIIIEDAETEVTMRIPISQDITFEHQAVQIFDDLVGRPKQYSADIMELTINLRAYFDPKAGYIMVTERKNKGQEVAPIVMTDEELHAISQHPNYEYETTEGPRKSWNDADTPPSGLGWERNVDIGRNGWERFDYHEESYWKRKKTADG